MKPVTHFQQPNTEARRVLLFFHGRFPKNCIMNKDATLPQRLFPNARFIIRCSTDDMSTIRYFEQWYGQRIERFVNDESTQLLDLKQFDAIYAHYILMCALRPVLSKPVVDFQAMLYESSVPVYVFYNDENIEPFKFIGDYVRQQAVRNGKNIIPTNAYLQKRFAKLDKKRTDFSNVQLLINENRVTDWGESCYKEYTQEHQFNICYLSDRILYDFLDKETVLYTGSQPHTYPYGVFIAFFLKERIDLLTKLFAYNTDLWIAFMGKHSEKLPKRWMNAMTGELIDNRAVPAILQKHSWTIYIGKACQSKYLGATFYEPLFVGLPVFIWSGTDKERRIFPDLDCYWNDERDLYELVNRTDLQALWKQQLNKIYENTCINNTVSEG